MKIAPISKTNCDTHLKNIQFRQQHNQKQTNMSFEGKHSGIKTYGGFAGVMSTLAGIAAFGFSLTALIITGVGTAIGAAWGAMLDSEANAYEKEYKNK